MADRTNLQCLVVRPCFELDTSCPANSLRGLPEMATIAAHDRYMIRKRKIKERFVALRPERGKSSVTWTLCWRNWMLKGAVNGTFLRDDIRLMPLLQSAAVVKGLEFPPNVRAYFETLMDKTGFSPLPAI